MKRKLKKLSQVPRSNLVVKNWKTTIFYHSYLFISQYNPNNSKVLLKIREIYGNFQTSKTLDKIFAKHNLIDCKRQPSNLKRLLCSSDFSTNKQLSKKQNVEKVAFVAIILLRVHSLNLRTGTNHLSWNQISTAKISTLYVIIHSGINKKYIGQTGRQLKEIKHYRLNSFYRQHIQQPEYEKIKAERHLLYCANRIFNLFSLSSKWMKMIKS